MFQTFVFFKLMNKIETTDTAVLNSVTECITNITD